MACMYVYTAEGVQNVSLLMNAGKLTSCEVQTAEGNTVDRTDRVGIPGCQLAMLNAKVIS